MRQERTELDQLLNRIEEIGPAKPNWIPVAKDCMRMLPEVAERLEAAEKDCAELRPIVTIAEELICFVADKYKVRSLDEFTCPIHRRLAAAFSTRIANLLTTPSQGADAR